ncbi:MAG: endopeptidase La [Oscillospiraceae bacterium]|jgi:ATP-dependent Lon protease|nr:endopeptidase La [Oscillospiraceae bacterium]
MENNIVETTEERAPPFETLPLLALRGLCVFPGMLMNFDVERSISTSALDASDEFGRRIFLITQRDILKESPHPEDLYEIGTICRIKQMLKIPGGGTKALVEGITRARLVSATDERGFYLAVAAHIEASDAPNTPRAEARLVALSRRCIDMFDTYAALSSTVPRELVGPLYTMTDYGMAADYIAQHMFVKHEKKQVVLEALRTVKRLEAVRDVLASEIEVLEIEREIDENLRERMSNQQREHILREHLRAIQFELGEEREGENEIAEYREKLARLTAPVEVIVKLTKEVDRLDKQSFSSAESAVLRGYLDTCLDLPWNKTTREKRDIVAARKILDEDHFGLDKVKERIVEFLAVRQMNPDAKGTIICLVGPPGTGKTSIAISIARALNRKLARLSLGGVHDEAEIRGHRKTYVGAMPGRIMDAVSRAGVKNPLMLLDEIDKLGSDYRGDPSAALLEALDPEQNVSFRDHFLELPFDLSEAMFITTANQTSSIPRPLLDRMEVIELNSYTDMEKLEIAKRHLLPKQRKKHGLSARQLKISDSALLSLIDGWTRESGVRQLERELAAVCRKTSARIATGETKAVSAAPENLEGLLGSRQYLPEPSVGGEVGVARGLAWTSVGGTTLDVEVNVLPGGGRLMLTGNMGATMKESAEAAVSYIRSRAEILGISPDFHKEKDLHIHFPEAAVQKDGPSAGITMAIAVISALTGAPVRRELAMTGEITLRGRILRIGGLKEKTMAAMRAGVKTVIIPADNEPDLEEIDQTVRRALQFVTARNIDGILDTALDFSAARALKDAEQAAEPKPTPEPTRRGPGKPPRVRQ